MERTQVMRGGPPQAGQPGMGRGNVPFAPGIMSGTLGQSANPQPLARDTAPSRQISMPGSAPPAAPPGPQPPPGGPAGPPMGTPAINPQVYFQFLDAYMKALVQAANSPNGQAFGLY